MANWVSKVKVNLVSIQISNEEGKREDLQSLIMFGFSIFRAHIYLINPNRSSPKV